MTTPNPTQIIAEPGKQEVTIIREFDAPRELVFQAHNDAKLLAQWLGPKDLTIVFDKFNHVSGGSYRYKAIRNGKEIAGFNGAIHEVCAPERIIQTFEFEGIPDRGHVSLDTTLFEELPNHRTRVTIHSVFRSVSDRDAMMASGMELGVNEGYEKLDTILKNI